MTDLLVVVADERARDQILSTLAERGRPAADQPVAGRAAKYGYGANFANATRPELPADSIVRGGREPTDGLADVWRSPESAGQNKYEDGREGSARSEDDVRMAEVEGEAAGEEPATQPVSHDGGYRMVPNIPAAAAQPATTPSLELGLPLEPKAEPKPVQAGLLRLHILVRSQDEASPASQAGTTTAPASRPARGIHFDPSVLDLGKRPGLDFPRNVCWRA